jgi:putative endonuclease
MVEVVAMSAKDVVGREGERAAVGYLKGCGFRIPDRHWRSADGEIDIVAVERHTFVVRVVAQNAAAGAPVSRLGVAQ